MASTRRKLKRIRLGHIPSPGPVFDTMLGAKPEAPAADVQEAAPDAAVEAPVEAFRDQHPKTESTKKDRPHRKVPSRPSKKTKAKKSK